MLRRSFFAAATLGVGGLFGLHFPKLANYSGRLARRAIDALNDFTRVKMREDGFYRRILPPLPVSEEGAISIPFDRLSQNLYIRGPRYKVPRREPSNSVLAIGRRRSPVPNKVSATERAERQRINEALFEKLAHG